MPGAPAARRASRRRDLLVQPAQRERRGRGAVLLGAVRLGDRAEPHGRLDGVARRRTVRGAQQHRGPNSGRLRVAMARGDHGRRSPRLGGGGEAARRDDPPGRDRARGLGPLRVDPRPARRAVAGRRARQPLGGTSGYSGWRWAELWTHDTAAAADFYKQVIGYELEDVAVGDGTLQRVAIVGQAQCRARPARARRHCPALGAVRRRHGLARGSRAGVAGRRQGAARACGSGLRRGRREPSRADRGSQRRRTIPLSARRKGDGGSRRDRRYTSHLPSAGSLRRAVATPTST